MKHEKYQNVKKKKSKNILKDIQIQDPMCNAPNVTQLSE